MSVTAVFMSAASLPVLIGSWQLKACRRLVVQERKNAARSATFRYMWDLNEELTADNEILRSVLNRRGALSQKRAKRIAGARPGDGHLWDLNQALMTLLTRFEGMAIGANNGVFDLDATWVTAGPYILLTCDRLDHFLAELRASRKNIFPNITELRAELGRVSTIHALQSDDDDSESLLDSF